MDYDKILKGFKELASLTLIVYVNEYSTFDDWQSLNRQEIINGYIYKTTFDNIIIFKYKYNKKFGNHKHDLWITMEDIVNGYYSR